MASNVDFVEYACTQMSNAGTVTYKKMFGEYGVYLNGKIIALICDNQFFLKITEAGRALLREAVEAPAYEGSKLYFLIEDLDDREYLSSLVSATYSELPEPKPKRGKSAGRKNAVKKDRLSSLPNIGETLEDQLHEVGIVTAEQLETAGSREVWLRIKAIDPSACINRLCALEGAIRGIRWHDLDADTKRKLKEFYSSHK